MSEPAAHPGRARSGGSGDRSADDALPAATPVCLALVQHANQLLITDGYDHREGISELLDAFAGVLALHLRYRIPLNLHLAGTLLESIAWHRPVFFEWVGALWNEGLLELVGSAHTQNILPLFGQELNRRQLEEHLRAYRQFLGIDPAAVRVFWVPERVWDTHRLAPLLRSPSLPNGGYRAVLIDDRLAYAPGEGGDDDERAHFDRSIPPPLERAVEGGEAEPSAADDTVSDAPFGADRTAMAASPAASAATDRPTAADDAHRRPFLIEDGAGLVALPISTVLRYAIPPAGDAHWDALRRELRETARAGRDAVAIFGDDLERTAGVGPWTAGPWSPGALAPYRRLLEWLARTRAAEPVLLSSWLESHPVRARRRVEPGTYVELANHMKAGETYAAWWDNPAWRPYRKLLRRAEALLRRAPPGPPGGLGELAWRQVMAASAETAWHEIGDDGAPHPAPWARATAAHARCVFVIAAAARWLERRDGRAHVECCDIDRDGRDEVVLRNDRLFAVLTPDYGARLVYLFDLAPPGGRLVVGNPADDWDWQEEANRFMEAPRNHPGAFADVGHENEPYEIDRLECDGHAAEVRLVHRGEAGLAGAVKAFRLHASADALEAHYRLPESSETLRIEFCLSPDYLGLLREGRDGLRPVRGRQKRGWRRGGTAVWVRIPRGEPVVWDAPRQPECGHGLMLCVAAYRPEFRLHIGVGVGVDVGAGVDIDAGVGVGVDDIGDCDVAVDPAQHREPGAASPTEGA